MSENHENFLYFTKSQFYLFIRNAAIFCRHMTIMVNPKLYWTSKISSETKENTNTMINSELLKEAIADAKAVRATALANAKASLEEAFAPRFEAMFAEKLKEESEEEEGMMQEVEAPNQVSG